MEMCNYISSYIKYKSSQIEPDFNDENPCHPCKYMLIRCFTKLMKFIHPPVFEQPFYKSSAESGYKLKVHECPNVCN